MALESGKTLGHYEITDQIGKGGMGEVYRARDTKLGREVAIKVLPAEFSQDEERLARLEREARMLAALNHPNIAAIYGLEQSGDTRFLVLELVEGDALSDRLKSGAIPVEEALKIGLQIAEALEAAHEKGVVHRDLKPANIKITPDGRVKVLDFGLAKAFTGDQADVNLSNSPTLSMAATQQGVILGTAAYMSPEQASGEVADHRADVWAFGVVLFEMLAGRQLFTGKTVSHVMGAVLERVPDWRSLPPNLHPLVRELLERCLEKDARNRRQTITDVRFDLQKVLADPLGVCPAAVPEAEAVGASRLPWVAAIVLTGVIALVAGWMLRPEPVAAPGVVARFSVFPPEGVGIPAAPAVRMLDVSSDGRRIAYTAGDQVLLRELDEREPAPIRGTGTNGMPTFSPDGQSLLYVEDAPFSIVKLPVSGGMPNTIFPGTGIPPFGLSWEVDDEILFVQPEGIMSIGPNGGDAQLVVAAEDGETLANPRRLPDGGGILFVSSGGDVGAADWNMGRIFVHRDGGRTLVYQGGSDARYVPTGHIVFARNTTLFAFPFDLGSMERLGDPVPLLVEDLSRSEVTDTAQYAISDNGTLAQLQGAGTVAGLRSLVWVDGNGDVETIDNVPADEYLLARISPDGTQAALAVGDPSESEIWIIDLGTGTRRNMTDSPESNDRYPVWTPDSQRIFFASDRDDAEGIYVIPAEGGTAQFVAGSEEFAALPWAMFDDDTLAVVAVYAATSVGIMALPVDGDGEFTVRLPGSPMESEPAVSRDGNWMAYQWVVTPAEDVGVYIRPLPDVDRTYYPGPDLAAHPVFSSDGSELFYFDLANSGIGAVDIRYEPDLSIGAPRPLFSGAYWWGVGGADGTGGRAWDLHPVTQKFLMLTLDGAADGGTMSPRINVTVNWFEELKELVPVP